MSLEQPHDDDAIVTILRVSEKTASGRWYVTDSLGRKYGTRNSLVVSLATAYLKKQTPCRPISYGGFVRDLVGIDPVLQPASEARS